MLSRMRVSVIAGIALLSLALGLAAPPDAAAQSDEKVAIGASLSLSGNLARSGQNMLNGYKLWQKEVNASGGLLGKQVELVVYDDRSDSSTSARLYEKLITEDKVDLVIGPYGSAASFAASAVAEKHKYPMLLPAAASEKIFERGFKYIFQLFPPLKTVFEPLLAELADDHDLNSVAILYSSDLYPKSVGEAVAALAKTHGRKIVLQEEFPVGASDLSSVVLKLKGAQPDIVIAGAQLPDAILLLRQMKEANVLPKVIAISPGSLKDEFQAALGSAAEGVMGDYLWEPVLRTKQSQAFVRKYKAEFNAEPDVHSAFGWSGGQLLQAAVEKAGSFDREKIREAFLNLKTRTLLPGVFELDKETGAQVGQKLGLVQWQGDRREVVWPGDISTAEIKVPLAAWNER